MAQTQSCHVPCSLEQFVTAIEILVTKPHSIDKRWAGAMLTNPDNGAQVMPAFDQDFRLRRVLVPKDVLSVKDSKEREEFLDWSEKKKQLALSSGTESKSDIWTIRFENQSIVIVIHSEDKDHHRSALAAFKALTKWCNEKELGKPTQTLGLVSLTSYQARYNLLKAKYAPSIIQVPSPKSMIQSSLTVFSFFRIGLKGLMPRSLCMKMWQ